MSIQAALEKDRPRRLIIRGLSHDYKRILASLIKRASDFSATDGLPGAEKIQLFYRFLENSALSISDQLDQIGNEIYREGSTPATTILTRHQSALERNFNELVSNAGRLQFQVATHAGSSHPAYKEAGSIVEQARRARRQIDSLLVLPFREHELRYRRINIKNEISRIITDLYALFVENGCDPTESVDILASSTILSDQTMFSIAVSNVIANAVVHARKQSDLKISIKEELCQSTSEPQWINLLITDNGPGIAVEDRAAIFQLFKQGKQGLASEKGSGVGLTFARMAMEMLGGSLTLRPATSDDVGATFALRFPNTER